jgi:DNA-binding transcriptional regulator/RsmH inhibitor MraZ
MKRRNQLRGQENLRRVVREMIRQIENPARVIELYYWSQEKHLCEMLRAIATMRPETRVLLEAFFSAASRADRIVASIDAAGRLTLSSPEVDDTLGFAVDLELNRAPDHRAH